MSLLLKSKKEVLDTADSRHAPTPEADRSILASDIIAMAPSTWLLKRDEAKMK
jgi:hypothetical protein